MPEKGYYTFNSAHFFQNCAKIVLLSENHALFRRDYASLILMKIKITSNLTLSILTLMNIHIVHLPVILVPRGRAPRIATSGQVQRHSGFEWVYKCNRLRPEPIRFIRLDSKHAHSNVKSVNRERPLLDTARGRDSWC